VRTQFEQSPFATACGLRSAIDLRIARPDGTVLAEGELELPCAVAGRDPACEVTLLDAAVRPRHACIQAVGGRVLVADLGGPHAGGPEGQPFRWLTPTDPVAVGPFRVSLRRPLFVRPTAPLTSPFLPDPAATAPQPRVAVRFLNGKTSRGEWVVNRLVTLVGSARDCKISLAADDIDPFHGYFVLTPDGLWVVDLQSRGGLAVNGEPTRYAHLKTGDELQVGRFRLGFDYLDEAKPAALALPARLPRIVLPCSSAPPLPPLPPAIEFLAAAQTELMSRLQASVLDAVRRFGDLHRDQMAAVRAELTRLDEMTAELRRLERLLAEASPEAWVRDRANAVQAERYALWRRLVDRVGTPA
jgi:pSer/pThr/pTyr-binding forkhead associated (FHA) protein